MNKPFLILRRIGIATWLGSSIMVMGYIFGEGIIVSKLTIETLLVGVWFFLIAIGAMLAALLYRDNQEPDQEVPNDTQTSEQSAKSA